MPSPFHLSHCQGAPLHPGNPQYREWLSAYTTDELKRDLHGGDVTSEGFWKKPVEMELYVVFRQAGICAGRQEIEYFLEKEHPERRCGLNTLSVIFHVEDGARVEENETFCALSGDIREIVQVERVILNLLGRMSGVATKTYRVVQKARAVNPDVLITPTRKTLWGWLDKRACVLGGGGTHRLNLSDAILIKDNHLNENGRDVKNAIQRFFPLRGTPRFFEIEVWDGKEAFAACAEFRALQKRGALTIPCVVMLDNVTPGELSQTLALLAKNGLRESAGIEVSGGITEKNVAAYAETGVDIVSMGSLTHSAPFLDVSCRGRSVVVNFP